MDYAVRTLAKAIEIDSSFISLPEKLDIVDILDIGCGSGTMLDYFKSILECNTFGIEINDRLVQYYRGNGHTIIQGDLFEGVKKLNSKSRRFDIIILSSVLEHFKSPAALLSAASSLLSENGRLVVCQSCYTGFLPRYFPFLWYAWLRKEHYFHFNPSSIRYLGFQCDLRLIGCSVNHLEHRPASNKPWFYYPPKILILLISYIGNTLNCGDHLVSVFAVNSKCRD